MIANTAKIYVDIDSILDIRQAILTHLIPSAKLVEFLNSDEYTFREIDRFPMANMTRYNQIDHAREPVLIRRATVTYIINVLRTKIVNLEKRNTFYKETKKPEILLNIHPFRIEEHVAEDIQNALFVKLGSNCVVTIVSKSIESLSPYYLKSNEVVSAFIYNFSKWCNAHTSSLSKTDIKDIPLYFPSIYHDNRKKDELKVIRKLGFKDVFSYMEYLYSNVADINFLPTVFYSNIVTATLTLAEYDTTLMKTELKDAYGDISSKV